MVFFTTLSSPWASVSRQCSTGETSPILGDSWGLWLLEVRTCAPLTSFSGNGRSKFRKEFKKSGTQTSQCVRGQSCTPLGKQFTPGPAWQQETNRAFASVPAWTAIVALHVYRASLKGKPAQMLDGPTGDQRGLLGWCKPGAVSCATTLFASRKRSALASALPSKRRRPKIDAWSAIDVKPVQLPEQRLTGLSRSGLLSY